MYVHGQNICRHFYALAQFPFTASELELDKFYQKVNVGDLNTCLNHTDTFFL